MATTEQIQEKAKELGQLIADHEATQRLEEAGRALDNDQDAQQLVNQFNQQLQELAQKQQSGQPIEAHEKQQLQQIQQQVATNIKVQNLQQAQMDYLDLVRQAFAKVTEEAGGGEGEAASTQPGQGAPPLMGGGMMGPGA
jgi:cell fate (sporulation/competence/biofilm development) regulator YlbF (YheA/YmcA/DUF963 family)